MEEADVKLKVKHFASIVNKALNLLQELFDPMPKLSNSPLKEDLAVIDKIIKLFHFIAGDLLGVSKFNKILEGLIPQFILQYQ